MDTTQCIHVNIQLNASKWILDSLCERPSSLSSVIVWVLTSEFTHHFRMMERSFVSPETVDDKPPFFPTFGRGDSLHSFLNLNHKDMSIHSPQTHSVQLCEYSIKCPQMHIGLVAKLI